MNRLLDLVETEGKPEFEALTTVYVEDVLLHKSDIPYAILNRQAWELRDSGTHDRHRIDSVVLKVLALMERKNKT